VFEMVKAIRDALAVVGIESTWAFVLVIALLFGVLGGTLGWLADLSYKSGLKERMSHLQTSESQTPRPKPESNSPNSPPTNKKEAVPKHKASLLQKQKNVGGTNVQQESSGNNSPNQTMINSPGGIQAGRDVVIGSDRRLIQSMTLNIVIETDTEPKEVTMEGTDVGLQSVVALFARKTRIRFASDWMIHDQQITATRRRLRFSYTPETPAEILGKDIEYLKEIDKLVVNYQDIFTSLHFDTHGKNTHLTCVVMVNGLTVATMSADVPNAGVLSDGQAVQDVSAVFSSIPAAYSAAVSIQQQ